MLLRVAVYAGGGYAVRLWKKRAAREPRDARHQSAENGAAPVKMSFARAQSATRSQSAA